MPERYSYITVDVFTDRAFAGNPLAVVTDASGLTPEQMQAIAAEFNYSESTFVLPPDDRSHTARIRIFTRQNEIPFAGHPNVGTAFVLALVAERSGRTLGSTVVFEEGAGRVPVDLIRDAEGRLASTQVFAPGRNRGGSRHRERQRRARRPPGEPRAGGRRGPGLRCSAGSRDGASESAGRQRREAGRLDRARAGRRAVHAGNGRGAYRLSHDEWNRPYRVSSLVQLEFGHRIG